MSIYKTYRHIESDLTINGDKYELEVYCTWYIPYNSLNNGKKEYALVSETNLAEHILKHTPTNMHHNLHTDQFGNEWYEKAWMGDRLYVAIKNGKRMFIEPTIYYKACQYISKDAGFAKIEGKDYYEYCYKNLIKRDAGFDSSKGEYIENYEDLFTRSFEIGERVFYIRKTERECRNGERQQVESFIIKNVKFEGDQWIYDNGINTCLSYKSVSEKKSFKSIESIKEVYGEDIWMWHHDGGCRIEKCPSTSYYLKYIEQQDE